MEKLYKKQSALLAAKASINIMDAVSVIKAIHASSRGGEFLDDAAVIDSLVFTCPHNLSDIFNALRDAEIIKRTKYGSWKIML